MAKNKDEAKIKFTAETGEFNKAINRANDEMSLFKAELKANDAQMQNTGESVEALEKKHELLKNQLEASQQKTEALTQKVGKAVEIYGENSKEVLNLKKQLANAKAAEENIKSEIDKCNDAIRNQAKFFEDDSEALKELKDEMKGQETHLSQLKNEYAELMIRGIDPNSKGAKELSQRISELSGELKGNKSSLKDAMKQADAFDQTIDDVGDSARDTEGDFTVMKGAVADLASNAIQAAIGAVSEFIGYLMELPEATREIRQDMATLETSFERQGFSTEEATNTWKELYKVFGEDDRAVEAANLISKMSKNQEDLSSWVTITKGVWGTYQDSLPVEGLAEASNETAKTGKVTGVLADALNWSSEAASMFAGYMSEDVTTAEDAFNVALSECTTEQERQALITETLTALYGGAAAEYEKASGSQIAAKEATAENILVQNQLADTLEPMTTVWQELKNSMLSAFLPAAEKISAWGTGAITWMKEHPVAMKAIGAVLGVVAAALSALIIVVTAYTVAQWAMNSAILANPITWVIVGIVAAIAAVVAIIVIVVEYWDQIREAVSNACSAAVEALQSAWQWVVNIFTTMCNWINTNVIQPVKNLFVGLWNSVKSVWDWICNAVKVAVMFIGSIISAAVNIITLPFRFIWENCKQYVFTAWEWIKSKVTAGINAVKNVITSVMNAIKSFFTSVWNSIKNTFTSVWNAIKNFLTPILNSIKNAITNAWNAVKTAVTSVMNGIKNGVTTAWNAIKTGVSTAVNAVKNTVSNVFNGIKSTATNVWNGIKNAITKPIEEAKNKVKGVVDSIKGFFKNMKLSLPKIKMPHFSITGKFSLNPPSVPKLGIEWYKEGGIMTKPTIFGLNGNRVMAGGEAGAEAILPIDRLEGYISGAIEKSMNVVNLDTLAAAVEDLANRPTKLYINGREFAHATAGDTDSVGGMRSTFKSRGLKI